MGAAPLKPILIIKNAEAIQKPYSIPFLSGDDIGETRGKAVLAYGGDDDNILR